MLLIPLNYSVLAVQHLLEDPAADVAELVGLTILTAEALVSYTVALAGRPSHQ